VRLHRLAVTAFGPFGGTQQVDFDALSAAGLFLLHGATGAGKTSVLDAVCYALYGSVPGARQQPGARLRSDHAGDRTRTEVLLELTVGGRRLEITRRPEQDRPKQRGTGYTRDKAQTWLREYDAAKGEWRALSRSHQEVGEEIAQLTGMSREQFCQVVLLPQGDFARFLRAGAEERAKLLGRLFDTGRFAAAEEHLARMRRTALEELRAGDEALLGLAHRMRQAAGTGEPPPGTGEFGPADPGTTHSGTAGTATANSAAAGTAAAGTAAVPDQRTRGGGPAPGDPGLAEAVLEWAALARTDARERRDIAGLAAAAAEQRHAEAAAALERVRELARRQQQFAAARQRAAELADRAAERDAARARLERARAASAVAPAVALRDSAARAHTDAVDAEARARARLPGLPDGACADRLAELEGAARQELGGLAAARRAERRVAEIDDELAAAERESRDDEETRRDAEEWLAGWEELRLGHQRRLDAAQDAAARAEHLAGRLEPARARLSAARRRDRLYGAADEARAELLRAREAAGAAHERWLALKERRLRGIAAELAAGLREGEPCAVCGSPAHPDPARPGEDQVDQAAEDAALAGYRRAESAREDAERAARETGEALAAARAESGAEETAELAAEAERLAEQHAAAHAAGADVHPAREALDRAEREHERRVRRQQEAVRRTAARASHREALQRERAALAEELEQARGGASGVEERAAALEERASALARAAAAARTAQAAAERLREAEEQLAGAARGAGFDGPRDAADAVLDEPAQRALEQRLERWHAEEAAVAAELADPRLAAAAAAPEADVAGAERALDAATRALRSASAADDAARTRCTELDRLSAQAVADARALAPARRRHDRVARLAGLTAGTSAENVRRMRLESYVLAARLEQVAAAASARLQRMSAGRYTLEHTGERTGGRGRSGLGLRVVDAWTGAERDTATLSGGETFSASLALALGLADVVSEEAGGTRLETLFIDEGFGSLDEQTLDEVLDVLDSLRERDRCVGIVSHVADLRRRIPAQLEVAKSRTGSRLRHRFAPSGG